MFVILIVSHIVHTVSVSKNPVMLVLLNIFQDMHQICYIDHFPSTLALL